VLKQYDFGHVSPRPRHPKQTPQAVEAFKEDFCAHMAHALKAKTLAAEIPIEIWFGSDAGRPEEQPGLSVGREGDAAASAEGSTLRQRLCAWRNLSGARHRCGDRSFADTWAMQQHLSEISRRVISGAHAVLALDKAGSHTSRKLQVPGNITLLQLLPASPELKATENIWQYLGDIRPLLNPAA
jgi:hypothetical protein